MPTEDAEDFHPRRYRPTGDTRDYVFTVLPDAGLPQGVACAVHVESMAYLKATKGTCDRFKLSETLRTLPTWLTEVSPGRFHSAHSPIFTSMMLKGLQMEESSDLLRVLAPATATAGREDWVDPTDQYLHAFGEAGDDDFEDEEDEFEDGFEDEAHHEGGRMTPPSSKPSDYVYSVDEADVPGLGRCTTVAIVEKAFFESSGHMDDTHVSEHVKGLPACISEEAEGFFVSEKPVAEVCMHLEAAGVRFDPDFDAFVKGPRASPTM